MLVAGDARDEARALVNDFSSLAFAEAWRIGVTLRFRADFAALVQVNRLNRASWRPLFPVFNPAYHDFLPASAIWLQGVNEGGETVATYAARALHWVDTTLGDEARSLRLFYGEPRGHARAGDFAQIPKTPGAEISGRTAGVGALWIRPDFRGRGLTKIMSRLGKSYACAHWGARAYWGFVDPAHCASGVGRAFGTVMIDQGATLRLEGLDLPAVLSHQRRDALLGDLAAAMRRGEIESSRRMETTLTQESPLPRRQGMANR